MRKLLAFSLWCQKFGNVWPGGLLTRAALIGAATVWERCALLSLFLALAPAGAATLTLSNNALVGLPGATVGWGFTIVSPIPDGDTTAPWLLISNVDFVPDPGFDPVGVFMPFLTVVPEVNMVVGKLDDQGNPIPWIEDFDNDLSLGIGAYLINDFQSPGDQTVGNIVVTYDMFSVSPDDPDFDPGADTLATGQTMSAPTSVSVTGATDAPEPGTGMLLAMAAGFWLVLRRKRAAAGILMAVCTVAAHAAYRIDPDGRDFVASNPGQQLSVRFHEGRADFSHPGGRFSLSLAGVPAVSRAELRGNRLEFTRGPITEWFVNDAGGLEQGFTIAAKLSGRQLELTLECDGDLLPAVDGSSVLLRRDGRTILRYAALHSWDAGGRPLPSRVEVVGQSIHLLVDDSAARYPVTVDPIVQQATLPPVGTAAHTGESVAIGPGVAVVAADNAVFVYSRTASGWSSGVLLRSDSGELVEYSVAAGTGVIAVGLPTAKQAFVYTGSGGTWSLNATLSQNRPGFGTSVAVSGNTILVGSPAAEDDLMGQVYIYVRDKSGWPQQGVLQSAGDGSFGDAVALDGDTALVGAPNYNNTSGAAFIYLRVGTVWSLQGCTCSASGISLILQINVPGSGFFGASVALDGDTAVISGLTSKSLERGQPGFAYVFARSADIWSQQAQLLPPGNPPNFATVTVRGDIAVLTAGSNSSGSSAFVFTRIDGSWVLVTEIDGNSASNGYAAGMLGDTLLLGSPGENLSYVYQLSNVTLTSSPPGRGFTLSGAGCGTAGAFTTPYTGLWSACSVQWTSPDTGTPGARYTFQNWGDGSGANPRSFLLSAAALQTPYTLNASFLTAYQLSTQAAPASGGTVTGSGWYPAGSTAVVAAVPNAGFLFTGFSGALSGFTTPGTLLMNGPQSVTGGFSTTPPAVLAGIISAKSGAAANRQWTISLTNGGPGTAYNAQLFLITFVQTFGTSCTAPPVPLAPVALPVSLGTLASGGTVQTAARFDFTGCPANARFTVNIGYMSNSGWSGGVIQLVNQVY